MIKFNEVNERAREYMFAGNEVIVIQNVRRVNVKRAPDGDHHRVVDDKGQSWYIAPGWLAIRWLPEEGEPSFIEGFEVQRA